ncbi:MAG: AmmeMemoRadiSam system protein B [bacterium]
MAVSFITSACSPIDGAGDRKAVFAGSWYPGTEKELAAEVDGFLSEAKLVGGENQPKPVALIAPHAGYQACGPITGYAYKAVQGMKYERVVILGPSHRFPLQGVTIDDVDTYTNPLGSVPLDVETCNKLRENPLVQSIPDATAREHSLEIQIPFLQRAIGEFKLVPIMVGDLNGQDYTELAKILTPLADEKTLFVASSDFTHHGRQHGYVPFRENVQKNISMLDKTAINPIIHLNAHGFSSMLDRTHATICGRNPIKLMLLCLPADCEGCLVKYDTSGRIFNDETNSVSYASIVFRQFPDYLNADEQATLLSFARETIAAKLTKKDLPDIPPEKLTDHLKNNQGAFVTIHVKEPYQLRGCIGSLSGVRPLYQDIQQNAISAATRDPRFRPMTPDELDKVEIEISVLSEMKRVDDYKDIVLGTHGIVLQKGMNRALYLPQVAWEQGWEIEDTLSHLAQKAGLPPDGWKEGAAFEVFTAQVFGERFREM